MNLREATIPTLHDLVLHAQDRGLVGDERTFLTGLLAMLNPNLHVIIESPSGAGKTVIADEIIGLLEPGTTFKMSPGSDKADLYDRNMHASKTLYVPELQTISLTSDYAIEMLKRFGEGKDYTYRVTQSGYDVASRDPEVVNIPYKNYLTTFAIENKNYASLLDTELSRRLIRLSTDVSVKQNEAVKRDKARRAREVDVDLKCKVSAADIQLHLSNVVREFERSEIVILYSDFINDAIDSVFVTSRTIISQAYELIKAITMFNYDNRTKRLRKNGEEYYVATPEDAYLFTVIMHEALREQALQLPPLGMSILRIFNEITDAEAEEIQEKDAQLRFDSFVQTDLSKVEVPFTPADVQERLRRKNYVLDVKVIVKTLNTLSSAGYLRIDETHTGKYKRYIRVDMPLNFHNVRLDKIHKFMEDGHYITTLAIPQICQSPFTGSNVTPYEPMPEETSQMKMSDVVKSERDLPVESGGRTSVGGAMGMIIGEVYRQNTTDKELLKICGERFEQVTIKAALKKLLSQGRIKTSSGLYDLSETELELYRESLELSEEKKE